MTEPAQTVPVDKRLDSVDNRPDVWRNRLPKRAFRGMSAGESGARPGGYPVIPQAPRNASPIYRP